MPLRCQGFELFAVSDISSDIASAEPQMAQSAANRRNDEREPNGRVGKVGDFSRTRATNR
jgi:hypothetical protein